MASGRCLLRGVLVWASALIIALICPIALGHAVLEAASPDIQAFAEANVYDCTPGNSCMCVRARVWQSEHRSFCTLLCVLAST